MQILRETNFGELRVSKNCQFDTILVILENFKELIKVQINFK